MDAYFEQMLHCDLAAVPSVMRQWFPEEQLFQILRQEFEKNKALMDDDTSATTFMKNFPVEGATASDYKYQLVDVSNGYALTSIRFKGLDMQKPVVEILHTSFPLESMEQVRQLAQEVCEHYKIFSPRQVRLHTGSGVFDNGRGVSCDARLIAAPVRQLQGLPKPPRFEDIHLERATDLDFYEQYVELYQQFYEDSPQLRGIVPIESRETLAVPLAKNTLFCIRIEEQWAGVIGVLKGIEYSLYGYIIMEEILGRNFRGKGYAPALQRRLLEELEGENGELLYGLISPLNHASLRTAAKVGRVDVGGLYWVPAE